MRSELVTAAVAHSPNRFVLIHAVCKITRAYHRRNTGRVQQSINDALAGFADRRYQILNLWKMDPTLVPEDFRVVGYEVDLSTPEATAVAIATGQLSPAESMAATGVMTFAMMLRKPPSPAEAEATNAESA